MKEAFPLAHLIPAPVTERRDYRSIACKLVKGRIVVSHEDNRNRVFTIANATRPWEEKKQKVTYSSKEQQCM